MEDISKFNNHLIEEEKSSATIEKYVRDVTVFFEWLGDRSIDKIAVIGYKQHLISQHYAAVSVNSILSSLNSFFEFKKWYGLKVKMLKIQKQIFSDHEKELTKAEYTRLLDVAKRKNNYRLYYLMQTICASGIRVSELKSITLKAVKEEKVLINNKGKMRTVILPRQLCKMLKNYAKTQKITSGSIFVTKSGKPLDRSAIWKMMKMLCVSAGVSKIKVFPHNLRHLFARTYYSVQKDVVRLADILGHSNINTTRIYTMESGEVHKMQLQKLGLLRC